MKFEAGNKNLFVDVPEHVYEKILTMCINASTNETGVMHSGYYSANLKGLYICDATKQTTDPVSRPCSF